MRLGACTPQPQIADKTSVYVQAQVIHTRAYKSIQEQFPGRHERFKTKASSLYGYPWIVKSHISGRFPFSLPLNYGVPICELRIVGKRSLIGAR